MKTILTIACAFFLLNSCKKETTGSSLSSTHESNVIAVTTGPVRPPKIVMASTTKSQFIVNADGSGYADLTLSFASKKPGIGIIDFGFAAYETNNTDAYYIQEGNSIPAFFQPDDEHRATAFLSSDLHWLPDDGSPIPITFRVYYNTPSASSSVHSGDTVSVQLYSINYISNTKPSIYGESLMSPLSPEMMITGAKPQLGLNIYDPDVLHIGLTRILELLYLSQGGSIGINNLPLVINCSNTKIRNKLVVKDENNQIVNTTTVRNANNYTIQFPENYNLNGINAHTFYIYANVYQMNGQASIRTKLQPASAFSWTDIAGGRTTPFTTENAIYYRDYPKGVVTITKNY